MSLVWEDVLEVGCDPGLCGGKLDRMDWFLTIATLLGLRLLACFYQPGAIRDSVTFLAAAWHGLPMPLPALFGGEGISGRCAGIQAGGTDEGVPKRVCWRGC